MGNFLLVIFAPLRTSVVFAVLKINAIKRLTGNNVTFVKI